MRLPSALYINVRSFIIKGMFDYSSISFVSLIFPFMLIVTIKVI